MWNDEFRDILEGDTCYYNQNNLLLQGPNKSGTVLGTRGRGAIESTCPWILCVEGLFFLTTPAAVELSVWMAEGG